MKYCLFKAVIKKIIKRTTLYFSVFKYDIFKTYIVLKNHFINQKSQIRFLLSFDQYYSSTNYLFYSNAL